ncbi:MAG TPA: hypothetical protein VGG79_19130 [Roseiarcus sp.]
MSQSPRGPTAGVVPLSGADYPVTSWPSLGLPQIAPQSFSLPLWNAHFYLAFALILMHLAAGLFHGLIRLHCFVCPA